MSLLIASLLIESLIFFFFSAEKENDANQNNTDDIVESEQTEPASAVVSATLEEQIINSVREKPQLWKPTEKTRYPAQTQELWEKVCREIGKPVEKRDEVKKMWQKLKDRYLKAFKNARKIRSGEAAKKASGKQSKFMFFEEMSFLSDTAEPPK